MMPISWAPSRPSNPDPMANILVISVHPDDETLGCGGSLLAHGAAGDALHWVVVTVAQSPQWSEKVIGVKSAEVDRVAEAYGMKSVQRLKFPAAGLDGVPQNELLFACRKAVEKVRPEIVYLVHAGDVNSDHRAAFEAMMSVAKPFHMRRLGIRRILCFETLSSTEAAPPLASNAFLPNVIRMITPAQLERKIEIMRMYASEAHDDPMPRGEGAIRALARLRGATVSSEFAEAFMLVREVL